MPLEIREGTWEEIEAHAADLAGQRVRVIVLSDEEMAAGQRPRNGEELIAYWEREGLIGTRPDIADSVTHARALRRRAEKRRA